MTRSQASGPETQTRSGAGTGSREVLRVTRLIGHATEPRFAGRRHVKLPVAWDEATRRRLRRTAEDGTDVAIALAEGEYLADGAVLDDDGRRIVCVARLAEPTLIIRLADGLPPGRLVAQALALGHAFGNQHVPMDIVDGEACVPLTTSESIARATVEALGLQGVQVRVADIALGCDHPLPVGHAHTDELAHRSHGEPSSHHVH